MKKRFLAFLVSAICLVGGMGGCGSPTESALKSSQGEENENSEVFDSDLGTDAVVDSRYHVGDTIQFTSGLNLTITGTGTHSEPYSDNYGFTYVYVEVEFENTSNESIHINPYQMSFYADNIAIENGFPSAPNTDSLSDTDLSAGRKAVGRIYAECFSYDTVSVIEAEFGDAVIVVKDEGTNGSPKSSAISDNQGASKDNSETTTEGIKEPTYGKYVKNLDNEFGGWVEIEVGYASGEGEPYINVSAYENGNHETAYLTCYLNNYVEGGYVQLDEISSTEVKVSIVSENAIMIDVINATQEEYKCMQGMYILEEQLDLSSVG